MAHQIWFWAKSKSGGARSPVSLAMRIRSSQRARRRWRISRSASWVPGPPVRVFVANAVIRCPTTRGDGQLRAGVGAFVAGDRAHALGPTTQVQQIGGLGDPCAVADGVVGVIRCRPHPLSGMSSSRSEVWDGSENPTEYDNRWAVIQSRTAWVDPAPSVRISTLRPGRVPGRWPGSWARAPLITVMWSAAVFDPALPGRSIIANGSPVPSLPWSMNEHDGWKPKPRLNVARASSFSEWEATRVASRSTISGFFALVP